MNILIKLFQNQVFQTVIAGVFVFVISQSEKIKNIRKNLGIHEL